jgi:hypothetical protein
VSYTSVAGSFTANASLGASLSTSLANVGSYSITSNYSGDSNYTSSSGGGTTVNISAFALSPSSLGTMTISSPGMSGQLPFSVVGQSGFSGTVTFACSGLPSKAACSFNPASVAGNGSTMVTVTTTAAARSAAQHASLSRTNWWMTGMGTMAFGLVFLGGFDRKRWTILLALSVIALLLILPACGGGSSGGGGGGGGTPTGQFAVTVTGTSGSSISTTTFTLTVL